MSLDFVEAIPSKDRLTQSCCPFHRERLAEGSRPESEKVQALPTRSTTQLRILCLVTHFMCLLIIMSISVWQHELWCTVRDMRLGNCSIIIINF